MMNIENELAIRWKDAQEAFVKKESPDYENESTIKCAFTDGFDACSEFMISRLRTAEQERDQYKAELIECSRIVEQMQAAEHQRHIEIGSLRAKIKEAQEPIAVMGNNGSVLAKKDFSNIDDFLNACRKNKPLFEAPVIPD